MAHSFLGKAAGEESKIVFKELQSCKNIVHSSILVLVRTLNLPNILRKSTDVDCNLTLSLASVL